MWFLFGQVWFWLIVSFVLGWVAHWIYASSKSGTQQVPVAPSFSTEASQPLSEPQPEDNTADDEPSSEAEDIDDAWKPSGLDTAPENADDLKKIKGIGAVNEKALNELGIYTFAQIAQWTPDNIKWIETHLAFPGRIGREDWVGQATAFAAS